MPEGRKPVDTQSTQSVAHTVLVTSINVQDPSSSGSDLKDSARTGLDDPQLLVLTAGGQEAAVRVEGHAEDDVSVTVDHLHRLSDLQVPDQDLKQEEARRRQGFFKSGMIKVWPKDQSRPKVRFYAALLLL